MKFSFIFLLFTRNVPLLTATSASAQTKGQNAAKSKTPVLVELFTSEGCSSCPPADKVLTKLATEQSNANADIITLEFHVDYWNYLGWKDEFSLPQVTANGKAVTPDFSVSIQITHRKWSLTGKKNLSAAITETPRKRSAMPLKTKRRRSKFQPKTRRKTPKSK